MPATREPSTPTPAPVAPDRQDASPASPRGSLKAFLDAAREGQWNVAARYLSLEQEDGARAAELAVRLKAVLDRHLWFDLDEVSDEAGGRQDDGLAPGIEEVGTIPAPDGRSMPLRMVRTGSGADARWTFARNVVRQIDGWYAALEDRWIVDLLLRYRLGALLRPGPFEILWWQWLALPILALIAWVSGGLLGRTTRALLRRATSHTRTSWDDRLLVQVGPPIVVAWTLAVFAALLEWLGLTAPAEQTIQHLLRAVAVGTFFWALWRSVSVVAEILLTRPWAATNPSTRHLLTIGANLSKSAIAVLGVLALLAAFGYPVTTLLAGLGIGGLAFAFGAQKTVENLFGSMAIATDQPFRVGDFVKVQDFVGTVEDIGLRSTRFRTLDRTVISIPNGSLADQRLESFAVRDRMRLATTIGVEYRTTRAQMQEVLEGFERVLRAHPKIWPDAVVVKFKEFGPSSLDIEIMAWFDVPDWGVFQQCRQEVLLGFMQVVEEAGTAFAFPTRTVHLVGSPAPAAPPAATAGTA